MTRQGMESSSRKLGFVSTASVVVSVSRRTCGTPFAGNKAKAVFAVLAVAFVLLARQKN